VFLHADLQRRLVAILTEMPAQAITATHAQEIIAEAPARAIVWISKDRRQAVSAPDAGVLEELSASLGSGFNLRLVDASGISSSYVKGSRWVRRIVRRGPD
jgi:hypothetical protein